jgi:hypothetical protein
MAQRRVSVHAQKIKDQIYPYIISLCTRYYIYGWKPNAKYLPTPMANHDHERNPLLYVCEREREGERIKCTKERYVCKVTNLLLYAMYANSICYAFNASICLP